MEQARATALPVPRLRLRGVALDALAVVLWSALIAVAIVWGEDLVDAETPLATQSPPLIGDWDLGLSPWMVAAVVGGAALALAGPRIAVRMRFGSLLALSVPAAAAWAVALSAARSPDDILAPVRLPTEYLGQVYRVGDVGAYLSTYTTFLPDYTVHVRGHPPGMLLVLSGLDGVGLSGAGPAAALMILGGALAVPAALLALREVAGEAAARRAAPFAVVVPAAIWIASSADAFFMGVGAWSIALFVLATGRTGARAAWLAAAGGLLFGCALMLSYGMLLLGVIPLGVLIARWGPRAAELAALAALTAVGVLLAFELGGFNWVDGLEATRAQYFDGIASDRPSDYFLVGNLAALAIALGPVLALALARLRDRRAWLLVGGGVAAVALAELSGMSKGEVERIWLPFVPWLMLAACALPSRLRSASLLLATQAAFALVVVASVATKW